MDKVLLTGRPGVGKTTVIRKIARSGIALAGGFFTEEIRESGRRLGFRVEDIHSGEQGILAHVDHTGGPRVGKYGVAVPSFEQVGVGALRAALRREGCILIDEIGKMELYSEAFREAVTDVFDSDRAVLATIPVHRNPFLDRIRQRGDVKLIEITRANRDALPQQLAEMLLPPARRPTPKSASDR